MVALPGIHAHYIPSKSMDYALLRSEGMAHAQALSGKIWTDYNSHDPGVTILEQLCYALTVLGYKTNLDLRQLVFGGGETAIARSNALYGPQEIFASGTVTLGDLRILFCDVLKNEGVDNVWFKKITGGTTAGLYDIYVRTSAPPHTHASLEGKIREVYAAHRSLGEDLQRVIMLKPLYIDIAASIEINEEVSPEKALGDMFYALHEHFNPSTTRLPLHELIHQGLGYETIFNKPAFEHGFIQKLPPMNDTKVFPISALDDIINNVPGIRSVRNLVVSKDGIRVTGKYITVEEGYLPEVSLESHKISIAVYRNHNKIGYDAYRVKHYYQEKTEIQNKSYPFTPLPIEKKDEDVKRHVGAYASVQNTFPIVYGIGRYGLPGNAPYARVRQARQLQSYLLFFDQIMINHLAQLQNLDQLFSANIDRTQTTYFTQLPGAGKHDIPDIDKLTDKSLDENRLRTLVYDNYFERKNRVLDHLLARFAETCPELHYPNLPALLGVEESTLSETLATIKSALLQQLPELSKHRNRGANYIAGYQPDAYPFKTRLCLLLNLRRSTGEGTALPSLTAPYQFLIPASQKSTGGTSVRFKLPNHPESRDQLVFYGSLADSYSIVPVDAIVKPYVVLFHTQQDPQGTLLADCTSFDAAEELIAQLVDRFKKLHEQASDFYVVEHVLLRPTLEKQYDVELKIRQTPYVLRSTESDHLEEQRNLMVDVVIYGTNKTNYTINPEDSSYCIYLTDGHANDLVKLNTPFGEYALATTCIEQTLVPYFLDLERKGLTGTADANFIPVHETTDQETLITPGITLFFPKWIPRFSDPEFRTLLRQSLCRCLPAHLRVNIQWLTLKDMAAFEQKFGTWQKLKRLVSLAGNNASAARDRRVLRELRSSMTDLDKISSELIAEFVVSKTSET